MTGPRSVRITVRLDQDTHHAATLEAADDQRSMSDWCRLAIERATRARLDARETNSVRAACDRIEQRIADRDAT